MKKYSREWWASLPPERTGKETEKLVTTMFDAWNGLQTWAYHRLPDAKSARGALAAQPADFVYFCNDGGMFCGGFIEVKACNHAFRIAKDKVRQLPTLKMFDLAGAANVVLVNHYLDGYWRAVPTTVLETGVPSWNLSEFPTYATPEQALNDLGIGCDLQALR